MLQQKVLFFSDRICCVCRKSEKPVQIHHIDENSTNNTYENLAILCFDCHNETMVKGGFGRSLNSDQIILYRDNWIHLLAKNKIHTELTMEDNQKKDNSEYIKYLTSIMEMHREKEQFDLLAMQYSLMGNEKLRDKYINLALKNNPGDATIIYFRALQNKIDLVPKEIQQREYERLSKNEDWAQRARFHINHKNYLDALKDYINSVNSDINNGNFFSAAFYLKEMFEKNLVQKIFEMALKKSIESGDLWWQIRALEELEWISELYSLLIENADSIEQSDDPLLLEKLERARGNYQGMYEAMKDI